MKSFRWKFHSRTRVSAEIQANKYILEHGRDHFIGQVAEVEMHKFAWSWQLAKKIPTLNQPSANCRQKTSRRLGIFSCT